MDFSGDMLVPWRVFITINLLSLEGEFWISLKVCLFHGRYWWNTALTKRETTALQTAASGQANVSCGSLCRSYCGLSFKEEQVHTLGMFTVSQTPISCNPEDWAVKASLKYSRWSSWSHTCYPWRTCSQSSSHKMQATRVSGPLRLLNQLHSYRVSLKYPWDFPRDLRLSLSFSLAFIVGKVNHPTPKKHLQKATQQKKKLYQKTTHPPSR